MCQSQVFYLQITQAALGGGLVRQPERFQSSSKTVRRESDGRELARRGSGSTVTAGQWSVLAEYSCVHLTACSASAPPLPPPPPDPVLDSAYSYP